MNRFYFPGVVLTVVVFTVVLTTVVFSIGVVVVSDCTAVDVVFAGTSKT